MNTFAQQTLLLSLLLIKLLCLHKYKSYVICKSCRIKRKSCVPFCRKMQKYVRNQREAQTSLMYNMPTSQSQGPGKKNSTNTVRFGFPSNKDIVIELPLVDYTSRWQKVNQRKSVLMCALPPLFAHFFITKLRPMPGQNNLGNAKANAKGKQMKVPPLIKLKLRTITA